MWWENQLIQGIILTAVSSFLTYVGWLKSKNSEIKTLNQSLEARVTKLENSVVPEPRVRELISEETSDMRESVAALHKDIKSLSELITSLRVDLGVLNYIKGIQSRGIPQNERES